MDRIQHSETQQALLLAMLIVIAEKNGLIKKTSKQLIEEAAAYKIFVGSQANMWLRRELQRLVHKKALTVCYRFNPSSFINLRLGMHFYYRLTSDKKILFKILDNMPKLPSQEQMKLKLVLDSEDYGKELDYFDNKTKVVNNLKDA